MVGAYVVPVVLWSVYKLVTLGVSRPYVRSHLAAQAADLLGLIAFFVIVVQRLGSSAAAA